MATKTVSVIQSTDQDGKVTLRAFIEPAKEETCAICHATHQLVEVDGVRVCRTCINRLAEKLMQKG